MVGIGFCNSTRICNTIHLEHLRLKWTRENFSLLRFWQIFGGSTSYKMGFQIEF